jgi:hypothetical protein
MPSIPFPNIPPFPGVPALVRPVSAAIAANPAIAIGIGTLENILIPALQQLPKWGIFDAAGNQLGIAASQDNPILVALASQIGGASAVLSTYGLDYVKEMRVADFPLEGGAFATYNKVELPANPTVTLILDSSSENDRTNFLNAIDAATKSTNVYNIVTPTVTYTRYTLERYSYRRYATRGAYLLMVEISLKEARGVSAAFAQATGPIMNPQNPASTPQTNNGITQAPASDTSTLKSLLNKIGIGN